jgi:NADPH-dependent 2,4-dienoyl-CoA reductase/sulfur reductase-like enzyme
VTACDLAVVGAGPAGLSGAVAAADAGCRVAVLDLGDRPGGQYWRWGPSTAHGPFHHDWEAFAVLAGRFRRHRDAGRIDYRPGHAVFAIEATGAAPGGSRRGRDGAPSRFAAHAVADDRSRVGATVAAGAVLVATGAYDRQLPFPGWTLPGVMAAGGAQALLKGSGVTAGRRVVVAGTGPFLLPVAAGLLKGGARVVAVVEAADPTVYLRRPGAAAASWRKLPEAASYAAVLARHRVPVMRRHAVVAASGAGRLERVTVAGIDAAWRVVRGTERQMEADVLAAGYGFLPQVELLAEAGAELRADADGSLVASVGPDQQTSVAGLYAAGETTGVGGAQLAWLEGAVAGAAAAAARGRPTPGAAPSDRRRMASLRRFATVMQAVHAVGPGWTGWVTPGTVVCRCEEVTLADIGAARELGADDTRSVKLLSRPGMGWCQGRMCGYAVGALLGDGGAAPRQPLAQPVPLRVLAELAGDPGTATGASLT